MKKVVVVDDDPDIREFMLIALGSRFHVQTAPDGEAGLELVRKEHPDLVILDLLMPKMHGFEVCQKIKADQALSDVKVMISSSKSYQHDISTAKQAGADNYIVKPFEVAYLVGKVEELIGQQKSSLRLRFWGTRGSLPSPGPATSRYGGNTPCTELRIGDVLIIVDAGSGMRELGNSLMKEFAGKPIEAHLFVGHTHWDHIQGWPFFVPAYIPGNKMTVYSVHGTQTAFQDVFAGQMAPAYFPVNFKDMASKIEIRELNAPITIGPVTASYHYLNHPGITVGYRFQAKSWAVSYISDHEPYGKLNAKGEFSAKEDAAVAKFVEGSNLLISEAQYTDEEYKYKRSWGHSTFQDVLELAVKAQVKQLALFHHDPGHSDEMMDRFVADCQEYLRKGGHKITCFAAQEGMTIEL